MLSFLFKAVITLIYVVGIFIAIGYFIMQIMANKD